MSDPKICVVSLIGKSQLMPNQSKAWKLNSILQKTVFNTDNNKNINKKSKNQELFNLKDNNENLELNDDLTNNEEATSTANDQDDFEFDNDVDIQSYFDVNKNVLYLNLESIFDTNNIMDLLCQDNKNISFFKLWENEQSKYVKAVLLLFSISHIIIVSHPTIDFDIGYIRFFRIVDTLRNKLLPSIIELIKTLSLQISKEWVYAGRPCSPRVLFTFENCPKDILNDSEAKLTKLEGLLEDQIYESLRKSYVITNISNNSLFAIPANNTFVYIHRLNKDLNDINKYLLTNLHRECIKSSKLLTLKSSSSTPTSATSTKSRFSYSASRQQLQIPQQQSQQIQTFTNFTNDLYGHDAHLLSKFLDQHINIAFKEGFNDNIGRTNIAPTFELPKLSNWIKIYETLYEALFNTKSIISSTLPIISNSSEPINEAKLSILKSKLLQNLSQIKPYIDIDVKFSMNRCKKSLPSALNVYQEGLPQHYTKKQHNMKLDKARHAYSLSARGPMYKEYLKQLETDCFNIWKQGRQLCEEISLTGNSCTNEMHSIHKNETNNQNLPIKNHNSNVITIATSNCGYYQKERIDPFNLKDANYNFYQNFNNNDEVNTTSIRSNKISNRKIVNFDFPIFIQTETSSIILSSLVASKNVSFNDDNEKLLKNSNDLNTENLSVNNLSQDNNNSNNNNNNRNDQVDIDDTNQFNNNDSILSDIFSGKLLINNEKSDPLKQQQKQQQNSPLYTSESELFSTNENNQIISNSNNNNIANINTKNTTINNEIIPLVTQLSSKTVYLEGMTHSDCQPGLLPLFSSWSLCSIGKYSDYSTHSGLTQIGFLNGHNFLLPWDIHLKNDAKSDKKRAKYLTNSSIKKTGKETTNKESGSTIRCYIGMEYECPYGHRFICSAPDRLVKLSSSGTTKDDATKLLNNDMPLYTACPCRNSKDGPPFMAQLMRVFIAVPPLSFLNQQSQQQQNCQQSSLVHIFIQPKVQPNPPPCPIFRPSYEGPIKLSDNSIWVLRLPYIYMGDEGPYYRPTDFETLNNCRVLKGMFSCIEK